MNSAEIIAAITKAIDQGEYSYGQQLPPTRELGRKYGTSQQTVAAALAVLAGMGLVRVQPGARATVIAARRGTIHLGSFRSANREIPTSTTAWKRSAGDGAKESPTIVRQIITTEDDADTGIPVGAQAVERVRTRYNGDGAPAQHKRTVLTAEAAMLTPEGWTGIPPLMSAEDVKPPEGKSIAAWLSMGVVSVVYSISTGPAADDAAAALTIPTGTPCFRIVSRGVREDGLTAYATVTTAPLRSTVTLEIDKREDPLGE